MEELTSKEKMRASRYLFFILGLILWLIQGCAGVGPELEKRIQIIVGTGLIELHDDFKIYWNKYSIGKYIMMI